MPYSASRVLDWSRVSQSLYLLIEVFALGAWTIYLIGKYFILPYSASRVLAGPCMVYNNSKYLIVP